MKIILKIFLCLENKEIIHFKMFYEILFIEDIDLKKNFRYSTICTLL